MEDDEDFGGAQDGWEKWFSLSPADIEEERLAAEQAGREAYADAIRTGADVQARTPAELLELGRARLAQQAGSIAPAQAQSIQDQTTSLQDCGNLHDALMQGDAFVRATANKATFGLADHLAAAGDAVAAGGDMDQIWRQYQANLQQQRARDAYDARFRSGAHDLGDRAGEVLSFLGGAKAGVEGASALSPAAKGTLGEGLSVLKTLGAGRLPKAFQVEQEVAGGRTVVDHMASGGQFVESKFGPSARLSLRQREAQQALGPAYRVDRWGPQHIGLATGAAAGADSIVTDDQSPP